jgi:hypothetical protein
MIIPRDLQIRDDAGFVDSTSRRGLRCSFHLDGRSALDDPAYAEQVKANGDPLESAVLAWARLDEVKALTPDEIGLRLLEAAVASSSEPYFRARTLRDLGEITLKAGLANLTVDYWRRALRSARRLA